MIKKIRKLKMRLLHWLLRDLSRDSDFVSHGRRELAEWFAEETDGPSRWMAEKVEELLMLLETQQHSGHSIGAALSVFNRLASLKPWGPMPGEDTEAA